MKITKVVNYKCVKYNYKKIWITEVWIVISEFHEYWMCKTIKVHTFKIVKCRDVNTYGCTREKTSKYNIKDVKNVFKPTITFFKYTWRTSNYLNNVYNSDIQNMSFQRAFYGYKRTRKLDGRLKMVSYAKLYILSNAHY